LEQESVHYKLVQGQALDREQKDTNPVINKKEDISSLLNQPAKQIPATRTQL